MQFATHDVVGRLARRLVELCDRFGVHGERGIEIELPLSQEELASWIGASREAVSKAFQLLRSLGIVETGRLRVTVLDHEALRRHAR
jgi:CRP-like cAMP-binding protein